MRWRIVYYCIYKLYFTAPLHCGRGDGAVSLTNTAMTLRADTVFSALCNEAAIISENDAVESLIGLCRDSEIYLSDTFPFCGDDLYLPIPLCPLRKTATFDVANRKQIKAVKWLPASDEYFSAFSDYINTGKMFDTSKLQTKFAVSRTDVKACISRDGTDTVPFEISCTEFEKNCGLYGIIGYESENDLNFVLRLFENLGISGIGGQTSRGFGKFTLQTAENNFIMENINKPKNSYMLLTSSIPKTDETAHAVDGAFYNLIRRGGFSYSPYNNIFKKQTQYYLVSGSVLKNKFDGDIFAVGENGSHNIYRYSKPLFLGVDI